jgi:hypothetical protein
MMSSSVMKPLPQFRPNMFWPVPAGLHIRCGSSA